MLGSVEVQVLRDEDDSYHSLFSNGIVERQFRAKMGGIAVIVRSLCMQWLTSRTKLIDVRPIEATFAFERLEQLAPCLSWRCLHTS